MNESDLRLALNIMAEYSGVQVRLLSMEPIATRRYYATLCWDDHRYVSGMLSLDLARTEARQYYETVTRLFWDAQVSQLELMEWSVFRYFWAAAREDRAAYDDYEIRETKLKDEDLEIMGF